ncbi:MAG TPA: aldehyde dehydrogenase family protein [Burkholderiales bacterium]|jgi:aldehyde dehydrogenase (NAD+)
MLPTIQAAHFIANRWAAPAGGATLPVADPSNGEIFAYIARGNAQDIDGAVKAARSAYGNGDGPWGRVTALERGRLLAQLAQTITAHAEELAQLESRDTGKPMKQARADASACGRYFEYYAGACDKLHGETLPYQRGYTVMTVREPHGVTGHIIPWNYPMQIFGRSVGAALAAGNACVVKPAEDACLSLLRIAELAATLLPAGALNIITGFGNEAGAALSAHTGIDHISFTGSPATGSLVAQAAAVNHRPVTLELGGKSPQLVFADADLDAALPALVNAIIQNGGQTCSAGSRALIEESIYPQVVQRLAEAFARLTAGPGEADLDLGPLVSARQRDRVAAYIAAGERDGLKVAARGKVSGAAAKGGYYVAPTLFADVPADHVLAREEVFGPVLVAMPFRDEAHAVQLANGTDYGLIAGLWTRDGARQLRLARKLHAGQVFINNYGAGGGVELPFGGMKHSGYGREKGFEALLGFTALKTIAISHG